MSRVIETCNFVRLYILSTLEYFLQNFQSFVTQNFEILSTILRAICCFMVCGLQFSIFCLWFLSAAEDMTFMVLRCPLAVVSSFHALNNLYRYTTYLTRPPQSWCPRSSVSVLLSTSCYLRLNGFISRFPSGVLTFSAQSFLQGLMCSCASLPLG